ncbi:MAG: hypothetical protein AB8B63_17230 [Granulosicoccus sp.]
MEEPVSYRAFLIETHKSHMGVMRANQWLLYVYVESRGGLVCW